MGTRNLTVVKANDEIKVAQYCQWDGYPEGQGVDILASLRALNLENLKNCVMKCKYITPSEFNEKWVACGAEPNSEVVSMEVSKRFREKYPELHRDTGAKVIEIIAKHPEGIALNNDLAFANDDVFCEWVYVIDLDRMVLETYDSYHSTPTVDDTNAVLRDYAVKLRKVDDINNLPSDKEFCEYFVEEE